MSHDPIAELLGAYAIDAVDADERAAVEDHLAECARCRAEVQEHRETAALLAHTGGPAPADPWQRISAALEETPPRLRLAPVGPARGRRSRRSWAVRVAAVAAVLGVAAIAVLGVQIARQDQRIERLQTALEDPLEPAFEAALNDSGSEPLTLMSTNRELAVRGVVAEDGVGYLRASTLPRLDADRTYQLWGDTGERLVSLGVLGPRPTVVSFVAEGYRAFAVTEEEASGVVVTANDPIVAGDLV